jgi:hypothetical protein
VSRSARFLYKGVGCDFDHKIIDSIKRLHLAEKWITVTAVGMDSGICPSDVSRYFRDHGIFWDSWRREWTICIPELAAPITSELPVGAFPLADWLRPKWLSAYVATVAKGAAR